MNCLGQDIVLGASVALVTVAQNGAVWFKYANHNQGICTIGLSTALTGLCCNFKFQLSLPRIALRMRVSLCFIYIKIKQEQNESPALSY